MMADALRKGRATAVSGISAISRVRSSDKNVERRKGSDNFVGTGERTPSFHDDARTPAPHKIVDSGLAATTLLSVPGALAVDQLTEPSAAARTSANEAYFAD